MIGLTCDICGGWLVMEAGSVAVCGDCGMQHSKERIQEKNQEIQGATGGGIKKTLEGSPVGSVQTTVNHIPQVIPKMFTTKYIEDEIKKVMESIADCESKLGSSRRAITICEEQEENCRRDIRREENNAYALNNKYGYSFRPNVMLNSYNKRLSETTNRKYEYINNIKEIEKRKSEHEIRMYELNVLSKKSEKQRAEDHYHRLLETKKAASDEKGFTELAKKFREMEGYKNTTELANECDKAAVEAQFNRLVKAKSKASTEKEFQDLAGQFRAMNGYKNTAELANECDKQYRVLKERREEQERIEQKRREEDERVERERRAEQERIEKERKRIEAEQKEERRKELERIDLEIREELEAEKKKLMVFSIVLGGIIGGLVFALLDIIDYDSVEIQPICAVVLGILGLAGGCWGGVIGSVVGLIIGSICQIMFTVLPFMVSTAIGVIVGALIGYGIGIKLGKKNK